MIRVIIERQVKEGFIQDYLDLIRRARKNATAVDGFIAGELLQEKEKPQHAVIISSWESYAAWQDWEKSPTRAESIKAIRPLLEGDEKVTILEGSQFGK